MNRILQANGYISELKKTSMAKVSLKGMKFYAFHGYYEFERRVGHNFILDVETILDISEDPNEQIENTVNYETIYEICDHFMQKKYKLLESVAYDIADRIKSDLPKVKKVRVTLAKLNPPLKGKVARSEIVIEL